MVQASLQVCVMPPTRKRCVQCSLYGLPTCSHCLCNGCTFCQKRIDQMEQDICGQTREGSGGQRCRSCRRSRVKRTDAKREEICLPVQPTQPLPPPWLQIPGVPGQPMPPPGLWGLAGAPHLGMLGQHPGFPYPMGVPLMSGALPAPPMLGAGYPAERARPPPPPTNPSAPSTDDASSTDIMTDSTSSFTDIEGSGPGDAMAGLLMLASQAAYVSDGPAAKPATQEDHDMAPAAQSAVQSTTESARQEPAAGAPQPIAVGAPQAPAAGALQAHVCTPCPPADAHRPGGS